MFKNQNFLDLPPELSDEETSGAVILPPPLDISASWKRGTAEGPAAIMEASHHIELYDEEVGFEVCEALGGIWTHPVPYLPTEPAAAVDAIEKLAGGLVRSDRLLISLGGEHSVSHPLVAAHKEHFGYICVLQIDAHADMRDSYFDSPFNHACPMHRIADMGVHITSVGIRSVDETERHMVNGEHNNTFFACEVAGRLQDFVPGIVESLGSENVYITIDLDGLDPSVVPAVGTPVPGGLGWQETLAMLKAVIGERTLVGADVVELCPLPGLHYADSAAARLVHKLLAYHAEKQREVNR